MQHAPDIAAVLRQQRPVEAKLRHQRRMLHRVDPTLPEHQLHGVARQQVDKAERQHRDAKRSHRDQADAGEDEANHPPRAPAGR